MEEKTKKRTKMVRNRERQHGLKNDELEENRRNFYTAQVVTQFLQKCIKHEMDFSLLEL